MDEDRVRKLAKRQVLLRATNEEIVRIDDEFAGDGPALDVICECARGDCAKVITLSRADYEQARSAPRRFVLVQGHELPEIERVVAGYDGFVIVEKDGPRAARLADSSSAD